MSASRRSKAYLVALVLVGTVVVALSVLPDQGQRVQPPSDPRAGQGTTAPPLSREPNSSDPAPPRGSEPPNPSTGRTARRQAKAVALRFLRAFLRYERGHVGPSVRRQLEASASGPLARVLLARPPRGGEDVPPGDLDGLTLTGPFAGELKASAGVDRRGLGRTLVELSLREGAGRWRIVRIGP